MAMAQMQRAGCIIKPQQRLLRHQQLRSVRPAPLRARAQAQQQTEVVSAAAATSSQDDTVPPPGCSRYSISIKKPLGLVLEQNKDTGVISIAEIAEEGAAAKTGLVAVGDQLIAVSGVTYTKEADYGGAAVKMGQKIVRITVRGETFKTVSAAIGSHPGHMEVTLEFQRC